MRAINRYKHFIEELHFIFSSLVEGDKETCLEYLSVKVLQSQLSRAMRYSYRIAGEIKDELIGDGKEAEFAGRLKTAYWELNASAYYFPSFESPRVQILSAIYGDEVADVIEAVKTIQQRSNYMVQNVRTMLDEVSKFVGYTPESQHGERQPQQKDLHYYCQKAIEKGYIVKVADGYRRDRWTKALLAYFLARFPSSDGTFPDREYSILFAESRLGKALSQLADNKNGDGKPRGYEKVDELFQEK